MSSTVAYCVTRFLCFSAFVYSFMWHSMRVQFHFPSTNVDGFNLLQYPTKFLNNRWYVLTNDERLWPTPLPTKTTNSLFERNWTNHHLPLRTQPTQPPQEGSTAQPSKADKLHSTTPLIVGVRLTLSHKLITRQSEFSATLL